MARRWVVVARRSMGGLFLDQMMFGPKQSKFEAVGNACFVKDSRKVIFYGLLADLELFGNGVVCATRQDGGNNPRSRKH